MPEPSLQLMYAAMTVYAAAMIAFAGALAFTRDTLIPLAPSDAERVHAGNAGPQGPGDTNVQPLAAGASQLRSARETDPRADRWARAGVALTAAAAALHTCSVVLRGVAAHRAPWGNMYEFATSAALAAALAYLFGLRRWPVRSAGVVIVPAVLLVLGLSVTVLYTQAEALVPALRSYWLFIHVLAAIISVGGFTLGAAISALHLFATRAQDRGRTSPRLQALPALDSLDRAAYRVHAFTFPLWTFAVIAGAIWAEDAWGRYWNWDPKEVWAFITWVLYAGYLHARATAGWRGRRADLMALLAYSSVIFNFILVNLYATGLHTYSGL